MLPSRPSKSLTCPIHDFFIFKIGILQGVTHNNIIVVSKPLNYPPTITASSHSCPCVIHPLKCGLDLVTGSSWTEYGKHYGHHFQDHVRKRLVLATPVQKSHVPRNWGSSRANGWWGSKALSSTSTRNWIPPTSPWTSWEVAALPAEDSVFLRSSILSVWRKIPPSGMLPGDVILVAQHQPW